MIPSATPNNQDILTKTGYSYINIQPDPSTVGSYIAIMESAPSLEEIRQLQTKYPKVHTIIYSSKKNIHDSTEKYSSPLLNTIKVIECTTKQIDEFQKSRQIPNWLLSEQNLKQIETGDYNRLLPITAELIPTLKCCFHCVQCSYAEQKISNGVWEDSPCLKPKRNRKTELSYSTFNMDVKDIQKLVARMKAGGIQNILITGGGEPLMNPRTTLAVMHEAADLGVSFAMYTNGFLLTESLSSEILALNPVFIRISIYGANINAFNSYTRREKHDYYKVLHNISTLLKLKKKTKSTVIIALSFLVHPITCQGLDQLPGILLDKIGKENLKNISFIRFTPAVDYFNENQHDSTWMQSQFRLIQSQIQSELSPYTQIVNYEHRTNDLYRPRNYNKCRASGWFLEVGPNGDVYLCCEKLFLDKFKIGNLLSQSVEEIYNSNLRKNIIESINSQECKSCPPVCKPHELNKVFHEIEQLRISGDLESFKSWRQDVIQTGIKKKYFPGKMNDFES